MRFCAQMGLLPFPSRLAWVGLQLAALMLALLAPSAPARAADAEAIQTIETLHESLIEVMKRAEELGFAGRSELLLPAVEAAFDLDFMAAKTLGPRSRKLAEADLQRWIETFKHFIVANYARQFDGYSGQFFETLEVEPAPRETAIVRTVLVRKRDDDVKLNYRLREMPGSAAGRSRWRIIDVYSNGKVSELALRRSEFSALLSRRGFEGLIETVENKSARK